jgi:glyoxylase-like metal-dependent hydrolase (beta-lactamase superfamily II)
MRPDQTPLAPRRVFLQATVTAIAAALIARAAYTQTSAGLVATPIADKLQLIVGAGANIVVSETSDGLVLVDSGASRHTDALMAALTELHGDATVHTLINSHWHPAQVGGNEAIGARGARIVAHEKTRLHLNTDHYRPDEQRYQPALAEAAWPDESFYTSYTATIGGRQIEMGHLLEAHTDGDIFVRFGDANVIAVGDALAPEEDPKLDWFGGGWLGGRVDSLALLLKQSDAGTVFVPGTGPTVDRAYVQAEHDTMLTLFERFVELVREGMGPEDLLAAGVLDGIGRTFDDPPAFVYAAHKGFWAHHNTLSPDIV